MMTKSLGSIIITMMTALGVGAVITPASANLCSSATSCTLQLDQANSSSNFGSGDFGTVGLALSGNTVTVTVSLATGFEAIETGFPGSVGFQDSVGGGLTIGSFNPSATYSGFISSTTSGANHFDGFGYFNDVAATTAPKPGHGSQTLSFQVTDSSNPLTDVNQLVNVATPIGGDAAAYFVVDVFNANTTGLFACSGSCTGLVAVTGSTSTVPVPEPAAWAVLATALLGFTAMRRRAS